MIRRYIPQAVINYSKHFPEAILANIKHGFPGRKLKVIGVTGTDGKTTTVNMIYRILKEAGKKVSMVSTINAEVGGRSYNTGFHVTSPHPAMIQQFLAQAVKHGDQYFVLEVTSHALDQFRVWGIPIEIGVITNITHEHLDYHGNFDKYLKAKSKLISSSQSSILNADDPSFDKLKQMSFGEVISFGMHTNADVNPQNFPLKLNIPGDFNILNALAAAAVGMRLEISELEIRGSLEGFSGLPGRMEGIKNNRGVKIIVDFAHSPSALENALETLRKQTTGKLIAVFGCASERDLQKRPLMGAISAKLADITILTDEDPRFEDPIKIVNEISFGAQAHGAKLSQTLYKIPSRQEAVKLAISLAKKGDTVGIFGKGHERSMNYAGQEVPWSDQNAVRKALSNGKQNQAA